MDAYAPSLPPEGQLVKIPIKSGNDTYVTGTLTLSTTKAATAVKTLTSTGISYAELRSVGVEVEATADSPAGALFGVELIDFQTGGKIAALYGNQVALADMEGYPAGTSAAQVSHYARLVVIGLRDKAELEKTNTLSAQIRLFASSAVTGTLRYLARTSAICDVLEDDAADRSD